MEWLERPWVELLKDPPIRHCSSRNGYSIDAIFIHYTAGGHYKNSTWRWWQYPEARASAHFMVGRGPGEIAQCVPLDQRAWHAGVSKFPAKNPTTGVEEDITLADSCAIGIEVANFGLLRKENDTYYYDEGYQKKEYPVGKYLEPKAATLSYSRGGQVITQRSGWWEPYPNSQISDVVTLTAELVKQFNIPLHRIVGHEDVAHPELRKTDPGPLWPWKSFMRDVAIKTGQALPENIWDLHRTIGG